MNSRVRIIFFLGLTLLVVWFLYIEKAVLTPFILGVIFAYLANPIVAFFNQKVRIPRIIAIVIVYTVIVGILVVLGTVMTRRIIAESNALRLSSVSLVDAANDHLNTLPDWMQPAISETRSALLKSKIFSPTYLFSLFPQALSRIVSFILFLFSSFYFLKEGEEFCDAVIKKIPKKYRSDTMDLRKNITATLNSYLRGQMFLVVFVASVIFIFLTILGVKFSLVLAIFTGFAEIVPIIGPIVAITVAAVVVLLTGVNNFSLSPMQAAIIVATGFFLIRQFQDYFVNPFVMGKITKLHPLVILFAVVAGEHMGGIIGLILAVPIAALIKILLQFSFNVLEEQEKNRNRV